MLVFDTAWVILGECEQMNKLHGIRSLVNYPRGETKGQSCASCHVRTKIRLTAKFTSQHRLVATRLSVWIFVVTACLPTTFQEKLPPPLLPVKSFPAWLEKYPFQPLLSSPGCFPRWDQVWELLLVLTSSVVPSLLWWKGQKNGLKEREDFSLLFLSGLGEGGCGGGNRTHTMKFSDDCLV